MNIRSIAIVAVATFATSAAFAASPERTRSEPPAVVPRAQTLLEELAASMREVLRAAAPEIALPKIELRLPPVDAASAG